MPNPDGTETEEERKAREQREADDWLKRAGSATSNSATGSQFSAGQREGASDAATNYLDDVESGKATGYTTDNSLKDQPGLQDGWVAGDQWDQGGGHGEADFATPGTGGTAGAPTTGRDTMVKIADGLSNEYKNLTTTPIPQAYAGAAPKTTVGATELAKTTAIAPTTKIAPTTVGAATHATAAPIDPITQAARTTVAPTRDVKAATIAASNIAPTVNAQAGQVQAATINQDPQAQFRAQQATLAQMLADAAAGRGGPSAAALLFKKEQEQNVANQLALANSAKGGLASILAQRLAGRNIATLNAKAAADAAILRAKEQQDARSLLGTVAGQARESDIGLATSQAQLTQRAGESNADFATRVSLANALAENQRNTERAKLEQAAAAGNQEAINKLASMDADRAARAAETQATLDTSREQFNAGQTNTRAIEIARQLTDISKTNATADTQIARDQAVIDAAARAADAAAENQRALEQGRITAGEAKSNMDALNTATLKQAGFDTEINLANLRVDTEVKLANMDAFLRSLGLDEQKRANLRTALIQATNGVITADNAKLMSETDKWVAERSADSQDADSKRRFWGGIIQTVASGGTRLASGGIAG